jgi:FkbM family methyltransferase
VKAEIAKFAKRILNGPPSEFERLFDAASTFGRYVPHQFAFGGLTFCVTDFLSVAYQIKEYFVDGGMAFRAETTTPVIYDCGANVGVASIYFKEQFPHSIIKAFEPDARVFDCLQKNISANNITGVQLFDAAVWIDDNGIDFGSEGADGGSVFFDGNKSRVASVRLADLLRAETHVDLLKMDIEGAETIVLSDCRNELSKVRYLFVEYHSWQQNPQELDKLLQVLAESGFRYYIHSIGAHAKQPFIDRHFANGIDVQLNIHGVRPPVLSPGDRNLSEPGRDREPTLG